MAPQTSPTSLVTTTSSLISTPTSSGTASPTSTSDTSPPGTVTLSLVDHYFIIIALVLFVVAFTGFSMYSRKRKYGAIMTRGRRTALERDVNTLDPVRNRGRYWQGRRREADASREEGLNENGEAPPPYAPKSRSGEGEQAESHAPAVPLRTLSREDAGLKPPDYAEVHSQPVEISRTNTTGESSSSPQQNSHESTST